MSCVCLVYSDILEFSINVDQANLVDSSIEVFSNLTNVLSSYSVDYSQRSIKIYN